MIHRAIKSGFSARVTLRRANQLASRPYLVLLCLYAAAFFVRLAMIMNSGELPYIQTDELLFMSAAKSLGGSGEVLVRGQPMAYEYILYPLLLSPLYFLPGFVDIFRAMQVVNILMMHAAIFPAYALAKRLTGSNGAALVIAGMTMLLPDMMMAKNIMTESLTIPLILWAFLMIDRALGRLEDLPGHAWAGFICALVYFSKPVGLAIIAAGGLVLFLRAGYAKSMRALYGALAFVGAAGAAHGVFKLLLYTALGMDAAQVSLYESQTAGFSWTHILQTVRGLLPYLSYHLVAFGLLPVAALLSSWRHLPERKRWTALTLLIASSLTIVFAVYVIYADELALTGGTPQRIHVRYLAAFFPVFMAFFLSDEMKGARILKSGVVALALVMLGIGFFPPELFQPSGDYPVDALMLSAMEYQSEGWDGYLMYLPILLLVIVPMTVMTMVRGLTGGIRRWFTLVMAVVLIGNGYAGFKLNRNIGRDRVLSDARGVMEASGGSAWAVMPDGREYWAQAIAMDVVSRMEIPVFTLSELAKNTRGDGTVSSVLPDSKDRYVHTAAKYPYAAGSYIVFDADVLHSIALAYGADATYTQHGTYAWVPFTDGLPWIHSGLIGFDQKWVKEGSRFALYSEHMRTMDAVTLTFQARAGEGTSYLTLTTPDGRRFYYTLGDRLAWYKLTFDPRGQEGPFEVQFTSSGNVLVETYTIDRATTPVD